MSYVIGMNIESEKDSQVFTKILYCDPYIK